MKLWLTVAYLLRRQSSVWMALPPLRLWHSGCHSRQAPLFGRCLGWWFVCFASGCPWGGTGGAQGCLEGGPCGAGIAAPVLGCVPSIFRSRWGCPASRLQQTYPILGNQGEPFASLSTGLCQAGGGYSFSGPWGPGLLLGGRPRSPRSSLPAIAASHVASHQQLEAADPGRHSILPGHPCSSQLRKVSRMGRGMVQTLSQMMMQGCTSSPSYLGSTQCLEPGGPFCCTQGGGGGRPPFEPQRSSLKLRCLLSPAGLFLLWSSLVLPRRLTVLFNENPDKFISRLLTVDETWLHYVTRKRSTSWPGFTTSILKVKCKVWPGNMSLLCLPECFALSRRSQSYGNCILGCWGNCTDWLSWTWQHHHRNLLCWTDQKSSGGKETRKVGSWDAVSPGQHTCSHVISSTGCHSKCRIRTTPSPTVFVRLGPKRLLFVS